VGLLLALSLAAYAAPAPPPPAKPAADLSARLIEAVRAGDAARITALLGKGANVNATDAHRSTPLMQACATASADTVRLLLDKGADLKARDDKGFTPLLVAAYSGKAPTVQLLLERGADPNEADNDKHTALMGAAYAGEEAVVRLLLDKEANVRATDKDGFTPLMVAAGKGNPAVVKMLLAKGADVNAPTVAGFTPLMQASGAGSTEVVRLLLDANANVRAQAQKGATALLVASYAGNAEIARLLLGRGADVHAEDAVGHTPLVGAAYAGSVPVAELLLGRGAKIEAPTRAGLTPLMQAAYSGRLEVTRLLLARGASVDARTAHGLTALMQSAGTGNQAVCRLLLDAGADINAADESGQTAVTWARKRGHQELIPFLHTAGARVAPAQALEAARAERDRLIKAAGKGTPPADADLPAIPKDGEGTVPEPPAAPLTPAPTLAAFVALPTVTTVPALHGPRVTGVSPNKPFLYRVGASGKGPLRFSASGLPAGLSLDPKNGLLTGKLTAPGTHRVTLAVSGPGGKATRPLTIVCAAGKVSLTPPMGWSAWTTYGETVSAAKVRLQADWLIKSGLAAHGFTHVLLDDTWQGRRYEDTGELPPNRRMGDMKELGDYLHARGLKFGVYSSPNEETPAGYAGSLGHEEQDAKMFAAWGADYLKYDWSDRTRGKFDVKPEDLKTAFGKMRAALDKQGRDIHFAVTPYGFGGVTDWGEEVGANSWWTSQQVIESWEGMARNGFDLGWKGSNAGPGRWNDPGWLLVGRVGGAEINPHFTKLTPDEQKTQLSLWSMAAAPLILSCDLTQLDPNRYYPLTTALLTNDEVLEIDQDPLGKPAKRVKTSGRSEVWARPLWDGTVAVAFFNREDGQRRLEVTWNEINGEIETKLAGPQPVRDLWKRADLPPATDATLAATVPRHGVVLLKVGKPRGE
jgi:alpha-galactosidase